MKRKIIATVLTLALAITSVSAGSSDADAAKKVKLSTKKKTIAVGRTFTVKVKNGKKTAKVSWKTSNKKVAKITKQVKKGNKASAKVKGLKNGSANITATYKLGKKKTKLTCKVTVGANTTPTVAPTTAPTTAPSVVPTVAPTTAPTGGPTQGPAVEPTATPTAKPTRTPKPSPTPSPTPMPCPVNPSKVDLSAVTIAGENGGTAAYNAETGCIEASLGGVTGFILTSPITEDVADYKYVSVTYTIKEIGDQGAPDVNIYLGNESAAGGQESAGWSGEIKLNQYAMEKQVTVMFQVYGNLEDADGIKKLKLFNFGGDAGIEIKDITFYMDGTKKEAAPFEPTAVKAGQSITIDGVASAGEGWEESAAYPFTSRITREIEKATDTKGTVKFKTDANNLYFYIEVEDNEIDKGSADNFQNDGIEILFDEDCCGGSGSNSQDWTANPDAFQYRFTGFDKDSAEKTNLVGLTSKIESGGTIGKAKEGINVKYALTDNGYSIEAVIPFDTQKNDGDQVNIDLIIQDCSDGGRNNEIYLYPTDVEKVYWNNTDANFGPLVVKVEATEPDDNTGDDNIDDEPTLENGEFEE